MSAQCAGRAILTVLVLCQSDPKKSAPNSGMFIRGALWTFQVNPLLDWGHSAPSHLVKKTGDAASTSNGVV